MIDPPIVADIEATEELRVQAESYLEHVAAPLQAEELRVRRPPESTKPRWPSWTMRKRMPWI